MNFRVNMSNCCNTTSAFTNGVSNGLYNTMTVKSVREAAACAEANCASSFTNATNAATSATNASNSAAAAAESAEAARFYLGAFDVAPTTNNEGGPLEEGMIYYNTVSNGLFVWNGTVWTSADFNEFTNFTATGTTTARNLVTRESDILNARDFGIVGDGSPADVSAIQIAIAYAIANGKRIMFPFAVTIRVPEDAPNLQSAINAIYPSPALGFLLTIRISSGYKIANGFSVVNGDFGNIQITSQDATVNAAVGFVGVSGGDSFVPNALMYAKDAVAPRWNILVDMGNIGGGLVYERSKGYVFGVKGVIDSSEYGLYVKQQSFVVAVNANFSESNYGNRVTVNSFLNAPQCNFSNTKLKDYPIGQANSAANLDVSRGSVVYVTGTSAAPTNLTGGQGRGLAVRRSFVGATNVDCSSVAQTGLVVEAGSHVAFNGSLASNCGVTGIFCSDSFVSFSDGTATGNAVYNIQSQNGGIVTGRNAVLTGAGTQGVRAAQGGMIIIPSANCRKNVLSDSTTDIVVTEGSYISAIGSIGGTNITPMGFTENGVIIKNTPIVSVNTSGGNVPNSSIDLDLETTSENATVRFFRGTNTTGAVRSIFYRGDGTATNDAQIGCGAFNSFFINNVGIGTSTPSSKLHISGDVTVSSATTATSATAGTNGDVPAQVAGYLVVSINGTSRKIPYYQT